MITKERLKLLSPTAPTVLLDALAPILDKPMAAISLLKRAHFMAQICHESDMFRRLQENGNYSPERIKVIFPKFAARAKELAHNPEKLFNAVYANRYGNGDEASGDGYRYSGKGLIQLTFKSNYKEIGDALGVDLVGHPESACELKNAVNIALHFFNKRNIWPACELDDVAKVTKLINGGNNGEIERRALTEKAKTIFV